MALIKCKKCGHEVSDKASKCPNCGVLICKECGQPLTKNDYHCPNCGKDTQLLYLLKRKGYLLIAIGLFLAIFSFSDGGGSSSSIVFTLIIAILFGVSFIVYGIYCLIKYMRIHNNAN